MEPSALLDRIARSLQPVGLESVEVYLKSGRSRRAALGSQGQLSSLHRETGWAVRASGAQSSFFCCGSGAPAPDGPWPNPAGPPLRLPGPRPVLDWRAPQHLRAPLCVEHEALEILEACGRELARELPSARLLQATLEDGESASLVVNSRGVEASWCQRNATLYLEAALGSHQVIEYSGEKSASAFHPTALARRIADRLLIRRDGSIAGRGRGTVLLAPPVAVRVLGGLLPLLMDAVGRRRGLGVDDSSIGSRCLTIVDDGRLPGGLFSAPVDGEGVPTRRKVLVDRGVIVSRLTSGSEGAATARELAGCVRRASFRDVPRVGPSHLFIEPDSERAAGVLLEEMVEGHYFLDPVDAGRFDLTNDRFEMTVAGFSVRSGTPTAAVSRARLSGTISQLLGGLDAVARDLTFFPLGGLLGSPSLRIVGLDVTAS